MRQVSRKNLYLIKKLREKIIIDKFIISIKLLQKKNYNINSRK